MRNALLAACLLAALPETAVAQSARNRPVTVGSPTLGDPAPSPSTLASPQLNPPARVGDPWGNDVEVTLAPPSSESASALVAQTDSAVERRSQAFADPWLVTGSGQLFSRPTFGERFKISSENARTGAAFAVAVSPAALVNPLLGNALWQRLLWGTQVLASVAPQSQEVTLGAKVNYSFADVRGLSPEELTQLTTAPQGMELALEDVGDLKPLVSLGIAGGRDFSTQRWGRLAANLAVEVPFRELSLVVNVDAENTELTLDRRRWSTSGTLAALWTPVVPRLPNPLQLGVAGKYTACLMDCDPSAAALRFGPTLGYPVTQDTLVAASLTWEARNDTSGLLGLSDVRLGLALSHSFGLEKTEASK